MAFRGVAVLVKLRLAGGLLALVVLFGAASPADAVQPDRREPSKVRPEYTVAAASSASADAGGMVTPRVVVAARRGGYGVLSETLTLVMVGSLLLGLAAAVRRTT
jgi:hypothetical protein